MYAWATPERLLDEMTLDQIIMYYRKGWEARKVNAQVFWGVLGDIMQGVDPDEAAAETKQRIKGLKKFKEAHPEGRTENGSWSVSR
jgi:hypothetical protein